MTVPYEVRLSRHAHDLDEPGHDTSFLMYAECNTPPSGAAAFNFDTFYDIGYNDLLGVIPAGLGLSYAAGIFTATEPGVWLLNFSVNAVANPGENGDVQIITPLYGNTPLLVIASVQAAFRWTAHLWVGMNIGDIFELANDMPTVAAASYATIDIVRIGKSIS